MLSEGSLTCDGKAWPVDAASRLNEYRPVLLLGEPPYAHDKRSLAKGKGLPQVFSAFIAGREQSGAVRDDINPVARKASRLQRAGFRWESWAAKCTSNQV